MLCIPFWIRVYSIPFEWMDRKVALEVGGAVGEILAIDWRDREGCWLEYIWVRARLNTSKLLRRIVRMVGAKGKEAVCAIKYDMLLVFCYWCGCIGHSTQKCDVDSQGMSSSD